MRTTESNCLCSPSCQWAEGCTFPPVYQLPSMPSATFCKVRVVDQRVGSLKARVRKVKSLTRGMHGYWFSSCRNSAVNAASADSKHPSNSGLLTFSLR